MALSSCAACDPGRFDHDANATSPCESCPVNTYLNQVGAVGCTACPMGRTSLLGANSIEACCPAGNGGNGAPPSAGTYMESLNP
jgi:hypothetical protein